jgi:hypothetical protein
MVFYEFDGEDDYEIACTIDDGDYEKFLFLTDEDWTPVRVRLTRADWRQKAMRSDFPSLGTGALTMRESSRKALEDIIDGNGECLPLLLEDGSTMIVFKAQVIDALDNGRFEIDRIPGTDKIMLVRKPHFIASKLSGVDVFRLPHRASSTHVSERFVDRVKELGLKGIVFKKVWSSL